MRADTLPARRRGASDKYRPAMRRVVKPSPFRRKDLRGRDDTASLPNESMQGNAAGRASETGQCWREVRVSETIAGRIMGDEK